MTRARKAGWPTIDLGHACGLRLSRARLRLRARWRSPSRLGTDGVNGTRAHQDTYALAGPHDGTEGEVGDPAGSDRHDGRADSVARRSQDRRSQGGADDHGEARDRLCQGARADDYCANIANPAADARFAWQKKMLADMEQEIAKRIALLEEKTAEYQKWLARRDEFSKKANETVLRIYARMRPDAAAVQLAALDEETAASVLTKLEPRLASLILNEMDPSQAVRLTATISGAGKVTPAAPPKAAPEAKSK